MVLTIRTSDLVEAKLGLIEALGIEISRVSQQQTSDPNVTGHIEALYDAGLQLLHNTRLLSFCDNNTALSLCRNDFMLADELLCISKDPEVPHSLVANSHRDIISHYAASVPNPGELDPVPVGVSLQISELVNQGCQIEKAAHAYLAPHSGKNANPKALVSQAVLEKHHRGAEHAAQFGAGAAVMLSLNDKIQHSTLNKNDLLYCKLSALGEVIHSGLISASNAFHLAAAVNSPFSPGAFESINHLYDRALHSAHAIEQSKVTQETSALVQGHHDNQPNHHTGQSR